jgi:hypothetical protein
MHNAINEVLHAKPRSLQPSSTVSIKVKGKVHHCTGTEALYRYSATLS